MSFFDHEGDDFHWLAKMLSSAGLLVMAAVFFSANAAGHTGSALALFDVTPHSLTADICDYVPGVGCSTTTHFPSPPITFWGCDKFTDATHPQCQPGSGNHLEQGHSTGALWYKTGFASIPGQSGKCWLSGGAFGTSRPGWEVPNGYPGPLVIQMAPNGQNVTYSLYCYETYETGWSDNSTSFTVNYCAAGQTVDASGACAGAAVPQTAPRGSLDTVSGGTSATANGWAQDQDTPTQAIQVHIYIDGAVAAGVTAGDNRSDLCGAIGSCNHGFTYNIPAQYCDGASHRVNAYGINSGQGANAELGGSPKSFTCTLPASQPTATISADSPSIQVGQTTTVRATYAAGANDTLSGTNIDSPEGTGLGADSNPSASKTISFTAQAPGTYTFYARVATAHYGWQTKATASITVSAVPAPGVPQNLQASCNAAGTSVATSWSTVAGADHYWVGLDDTSNNAASCQSNWMCTTPPDYTLNQSATSKSFSTASGHALRLMVSSCTSGNTCSAAAEKDFTCSEPASALTITANGQTGLAAIPVNTPVTVAWSSSNVEPGSCSVTNNAGAPAYTGDSGSQNIGTLAGTRIYTLNCNKISGGAATPATVTIGVQPGSIDGPLTAKPARVQIGTQTHLSWHTVGMISCSLAGNSTGQISSSLASSDTPATVPSATTFTLTCNDGASSFSQSVDVGVIPRIIEQ